MTDSNQTALSSSSSSSSMPADQKLYPTILAMYHQFHNMGQTKLLISTAIILNSIAIPSILLNLSIVFVTIKHKSLRGTSSFLLSLTALFECLHQLGHLFFLYVAISGTNFIPYSTCFKFLILSYICSMASICSISLTGFDRLLQLLFEKWHSRLNTTIYLPFLIIFAIANGCIIGYKFYKISLLIPNLPTTGLYNDVLTVDLGNWMGMYSSFWNILGALFYLAIWIVFKFKTVQHSLAAKANAKLLRSLSIIIGINIGSYFIVMVLFNIHIRPMLTTDLIQIWILETYVGYYMNFCIALNAPVVYFCSGDYRKSFNAEFAVLIKRFNVKFFLNLIKIKQPTSVTPAA